MTTVSWLIMMSRLATSFPSGRFITILGLRPTFGRLKVSQQQRPLSANPKRGSIIDTYRTVSVNCTTCGWQLFRYKKKNGIKSGLVKCYVERILVDDDCAYVESFSASNHSRSEEEDGHDHNSSNNNNVIEYKCPKCQTRFARSAIIHGLPALKLVGGKVRMTKK